MPDPALTPRGQGGGDDVVDMGVRQAVLDDRSARPHIPGISSVRACCSMWARSS
jgi:hypothetical protein